MQQSGFATAGITRDADDATLSLENLLTGIVDYRQLAIPPDQASRGAILDGQPIVAPRQASDELVELHPPIETLDLGASQWPQLQIAIDQSSGLRCHQDRVGRCDLLHAGSKVHDLAVSVVACEVMRHQRFDDDLARAKADTQADDIAGRSGPDRLLRSFADPERAEARA
jgi:hypothetical protein